MDVGYAQGQLDRVVIPLAWQRPPDLLTETAVGVLRRSDQLLRELAS